MAEMTLGKGQIMQSPGVLAVPKRVELITVIININIFRVNFRINKLMKSKPFLSCNNLGQKFQMERRRREV